MLGQFGLIHKFAMVACFAAGCFVGAWLVGQTALSASDLLQSATTVFVGTTVVVSLDRARGRTANLQDRCVAHVDAMLRCATEAVNSLGQATPIAPLTPEGWGGLMVLANNMDGELDLLVERLNGSLCPPAAKAPLLQAARDLEDRAEELHDLILERYGDATFALSGTERHKLDFALYRLSLEAGRCKDSLVSNI